MSISHDVGLSSSNGEQAIARVGRQWTFSETAAACRDYHDYNGQACCYAPVQAVTAWRSGGKGWL